MTLTKEDVKEVINERFEAFDKKFDDFKNETKKEFKTFKSELQGQMDLLKEAVQKAEKSSETVSEDLKKVKEDVAGIKKTSGYGDTKKVQDEIYWWKVLNGLTAAGMLFMAAKALIVAVYPASAPIVNNFTPPTMG